MPEGALPGRALEARDWALVANGSLKVNDRVSVVRWDSGYAAIANQRNPTEIGADAAVGTVVTRGSPFLRDRATVHGDLVVSGIPWVQNPGTLLVTGSWLEQSALADEWRRRPWHLELPSLAERPDVTVGSGGPTRELPPGEYRRIMVYPGGSLRLQPGQYVVEDLWLEPNATLLFTTGAEPVEILVRGYLTHRGIITDEAAQQDRVGLVVTCASDHWFHIEAPFQGTILAPNGTLVLASKYHRGQFIARNIEVHQDAVVTLAPAYRRPVAADLELNPEMVVGGSGSIEDPYLVARDNPEFLGTVALRVDTAVTGGGCREGARVCRWNWGAGPIATGAEIVVDEHVLAADAASVPARRTTQFLPLIPDALDGGMSMSGPGSAPWRTRGGTLRRHDAVYEVWLQEQPLLQPPPWVEPGSAPRFWMRLAPHVAVVPVVVARLVDPTNTYLLAEQSRMLDWRERDRQLLDGLAPILDTGGAIDGQYLAAVSTWGGGFEPYSALYGDLPWAADGFGYAPDEVFAQCEHMIDPDSGELMPEVVQFQAVAMLDVPPEPPGIVSRCLSTVPAFGWDQLACELDVRSGGRGIAQYFQNAGSDAEATALGVWHCPHYCGFKQLGWTVGNQITLPWAPSRFSPSLLAHEFGHDSYLGGLVRPVTGSDDVNHLVVEGNLMHPTGEGADLLPGQCPVDVRHDLMEPLLQVLDAGPVGLCRTLPRAGTLGMEAMAPVATAAACALRGGESVLAGASTEPVCCSLRGSYYYVRDDGPLCPLGEVAVSMSYCANGGIIPIGADGRDTCCRFVTQGGYIYGMSLAAECPAEQVSDPALCEWILR